MPDFILDWPGGFLMGRRGQSDMPTLSNLVASATTATTASIEFDTSRYGDNYAIYVQQPVGAQPSEADIYAGTGAAWHTTFGPLLAETVIPGPTGLTAETAYRVYVMAKHPTFTLYSNVLTDDFTTPAADVTAPVLSSPTLAVVDETTLDPGVTTDEGNGTLYWVLTQSATQPSEAQIKAGQDHTGTAADASDSLAVLASGVQDFGTIGSLSGANTYYFHAVQDDASANASNRVSSTGAQPADVTAPVLSSATDDASGSDAMTGSVNSDTGEGTLYWVVTQSATSPSAAQVAAGQDHLGAAADASGSQAANALGNNTVASSGLSGSTAYYTHYMHRDSASNDSSVISADGFTTDSATAFFEQYQDGDTAGSILLNATITANQADSDGGTDAVLFSGDGLGPASLEFVRLTNAITFVNGVNHVRLKAKTISKDDTKMWLRVESANVDTLFLYSFDITDDATPVGSRAPDTGSVTSLGSDWYEIYFTVDMTGDTDLAGYIVLKMGIASNTPYVINDTANNDVALHDFTAATS